MSEASKKEQDKIPQSIGIIMDGNRRWARARGLPTLEGHRRGYQKMKEVTRWAKEAGVKYLTLFAFSTENWNRKEEEVSYLMDLFKEALLEGVKELAEEDARVKIAGQKERFSKELQELMQKVEEDTEDNDAITVTLCLSYGGRAEIIDGVNRAIEKGEKVTEESFEALLWTSHIADPDIIIRTSGEERVSGFLTWKAVYSEFFFIKPHWPEFSKEDFEGILKEYAERDRRHGK
ncbi:MAG: polyprenyl diphosphate synthase [Candidatus Paceibacterota bacterium]